MKTNKRKMGLNVVSLFPYSLGSRGLENSVKWAHKAGFDGIQALPLRGWQYKNDEISELDNQIISYEDAYMFGSFWNAIKRTAGIIGEPAPLLLDWGLFGRADSMPFRSSNGIYVSHYLDNGIVLELAPEISTYPGFYLEYARRGGFLCWDIEHVLRMSRKNGRKIDDALMLLKQLPSDSVKLIHVHLLKDEIQSFIRGQRSLKTLMLVILGKKFPQVPAIVEVFPPAWYLPKSLTLLSEIRKQAQTLLELDN